jgi:transcriptional regulator with XRE-family HTH domain
MQVKKRDGKRRGGRPKIDSPSIADLHVGAQVRLRRTLLGMSQEKLGNSLGLTFQQIQKYERGANRIGAARLFDIARVLDVPIQFFFEGMPAELQDDVYNPADVGDPALEIPPQQDPMARRETLELVRAYYRIPDANLRRRLFEFTKALGSMSPTATKVPQTTQS